VNVLPLSNRSLKKWANLLKIFVWGDANGGQSCVALCMQSINLDIVSARRRCVPLDQASLIKGGLACKVVRFFFFHIFDSIEFLIYLLAISSLLCFTHSRGNFSAIDTPHAGWSM